MEEEDSANRDNSKRDKLDERDRSQRDSSKRDRLEERDSNKERQFSQEQLIERQVEGESSEKGRPVKRETGWKRQDGGERQLKVERQERSVTDHDRERERAQKRDISSPRREK